MIKHGIRQFHLGILVLILGCFSFLVAGCTIPQPTTTRSSVFSIHPGIRASLVHNPTGTANLIWSESSHVLLVSLSVTGLAPNSTHLAHIHAGNCTAMGQVVYSLRPLIANAHGIGSSTTTIIGVMAGIVPSGGWAINIHNGPSLATPLEARPISCGNVASVRATRGTQSAQIQLSSMISLDGAVHGMAQLRMMMDRRLTVALLLSGLAPNTVHMAHIHAGSCAAQGPVVYALSPIVADAAGNTMSITTLIINNQLPAHLYINVHEAGTMAAMRTSQGFDPIACGNIG